MILSLTADHGRRHQKDCLRAAGAVSVQDCCHSAEAAAYPLQIPAHTDGDCCSPDLLLEAAPLITHPHHGTAPLTTMLLLALTLFLKARLVIPTRNPETQFCLMCVQPTHVPSRLQARVCTQNPIPHSLSPSSYGLGLFHHQV